MFVTLSLCKEVMPLVNSISGEVRRLVQESNEIMVSLQPSMEYGFSLNGM